MLSKAKTQWAMHQLYKLIPDAQGALVADSPFQLLIAVMLSAQATDVPSIRSPHNYLLISRHQLVSRMQRLPILKLIFIQSGYIIIKLNTSKHAASN